MLRKNGFSIRIQPNKFIRIMSSSYCDLKKVLRRQTSVSSSYALTLAATEETKDEFHVSLSGSICLVANCKARR